jgi:hypothetical protein
VSEHRADPRCEYLTVLTLVQALRMGFHWYPRKVNLSSLVERHLMSGKYVGKVSIGFVYLLSGFTLTPLVAFSMVVFDAEFNSLSNGVIFNRDHPATMGDSDQFTEIPDLIV